MSSYTKSTDFASKDALLTGNPLKVVKGTEIDDEFNSIQTAVNSKADTNSPALTGTPTAPTASSATNTTQIATTAFVQAALSAVYPVGSIYTNATSSTNPNTLLGFGTWEAFGAGRVLVGLDAGDTLFDTVGETGGSKDSVVVTHNHTVTDSGHDHTMHGQGTTSGFYLARSTSQRYSGGGSDLFGGQGSPDTGMRTSSETTGISLADTGESGTNKNIQPYVVVYMWKRTA